MSLAGDCFTILFVCTANVCRSAIAERLLRAELAGCENMRVESAGTAASPGAAMHPASAAVLKDLGGDASGFTSRALTSELAAAAGLVLTATRDQRGSVAMIHPRAARRAFTIREFARLADAVEATRLAECAAPAARARRLADEAIAHRGYLPPMRPPDFDIPDPIGRPREFHESVGIQIARIIWPLARLLTSR